MAGPCDCADPEVTGCQCIEEATSTITPSGAGSVGDPRVHDVNLDPDTRNAIEDTGTGLLVLHDLDAARIRSDSNQSLAGDANWHTVVMDVVMYDFGGLYNGSNGFTVVRPGVYITTFHVDIGGGSGGAGINVGILKNGIFGAIQTADSFTHSIAFMSSGPVGATFSYQVKLNTGTGYSIEHHNNWSAYATIAQLNNLSDGQPDF